MSQCVFEHRARKPWSSLTWSEAQTQTDAHVFSDLSKSMLVFMSSVWKANVVLSANTQRVLLLLVLSVCKSCFFGFHYRILIHKRTSYDCHDLLEKRPEANEPVGCTLCIFEKKFAAVWLPYLREDLIIDLSLCKVTFVKQQRTSCFLSFSMKLRLQK